MRADGTFWTSAVVIANASPDVHVALAVLVLAPASVPPTKHHVRTWRSFADHQRIRRAIPDSSQCHGRVEVENAILAAGARAVDSEVRREASCQRGDFLCGQCTGIGGAAKRRVRQFGQAMRRILAEVAFLPKGRERFFRECVVFQFGKDPHVPTHERLGILGILRLATRRQGPMGLGVLMQGQCELAHPVLAIQTRSRGADVLNTARRQRDQDSEDRDDDEEFQKRKGSPTTSMHSTTSIILSAHTPAPIRICPIFIAK